MLGSLLELASDLFRMRKLLSIEVSQNRFQDKPWIPRTLKTNSNYLMFQRCYVRVVASSLHLDLYSEIGGIGRIQVAQLQKWFPSYSLQQHSWGGRVSKYARLFSLSGCYHYPKNNQHLLYRCHKNVRGIQFLSIFILNSLIVNF